jgi:uncharacterized protein YdhG (YjbR/CyaY superfamily)
MAGGTPRAGGNTMQRKETTLQKVKQGTPARTVSEYLSVLPPAERRMLKKLRATIKDAAPKAEERISYRMPLYFYLGYLVGFAAFNNHCSFFVMSYKVLGMFEKELKPYRKATATLHFTAEKPLPVSLVKKIVKARIEENEMKKRIKNSERSIS